jgi:DNA-binding CsgD family transcriptional regulator
MTLTLTSCDLARFQMALGVLLAPLDEGSVDAWRSAVNRSLRALVEADSAAFLLPPTSGAAFAYSEELTTDQLEQLVERRPADEAIPRARAAGLEVWNQTRIIAGDWAAYHRDQTVNEYLKPNRLLDGVGFLVEAPEVLTSGMVYLYRSDYGSELFGEKGLGLLELLLPAFKAGVRTCLRLAEHRTTLNRVLDDLGQALMVCNRDGQTVHCSPALLDLLAQDPERERVRGAMLWMAQSLPERKRPDLAVRRTAELGIETPVARYRIRGSHLAQGLLGPTATILVALDCVTRPTVPSDVLRRRFGLTARQAQVAYLLAAGRSDADIARTLGVRLRTAEHHVEAVRLRLGVKSRAQVPALLSADWAPKLPHA